MTAGKVIGNPWAVLALALILVPELFVRAGAKGAGAQFSEENCLAAGWHHQKANAYHTSEKWLRKTEQRCKWKLRVLSRTEKVRQTGVLDGQEIAAPHPPHP